MCLGKVVLEADATQLLQPAGPNCRYSLSHAKSASLCPQLINPLNFIFLLVLLWE